MIQVGIIGSGFIGPAHLEALRTPQTPESEPLDLQKHSEKTP